MSKVIGIIGSRHRDSDADYQACLTAFLQVCVPGDSIVSGGCPRGGDRFAEVIARGYGVPIKIHYAEWDKHGRSAGFKRNVDIARDADVLIAVVSADRTGGTEDTIRKAIALGKQVILVEQVKK